MIINDNHYITKRKVRYFFQIGKNSNLFKPFLNSLCVRIKQPKTGWIKHVNVFTKPFEL